ncbi:hypothetical protein BDY19DRAFT_947278 [Irpex rosettiformis]|uniref:Uncharacterized protein n=1 Tax=Irpex rosettiformis TaxID=378272 RepID=A0ACB8U3T8_9APHY|nr:hypothetical protein BDY19DRAFT_947278 [Irpex rosettiformis]
MLTSITTLVLFNVYKFELHYAGTLMLLAKVYANSLLAMLNIREGLKRDALSNDELGFSLELSNQISIRPESY